MYGAPGESSGGGAWLAKRAGSQQRTYGYGKATVLAALAVRIALTERH